MGCVKIRREPEFVERSQSNHLNLQRNQSQLNQALKFVEKELIQGLKFVERHLKQALKFVENHFPRVNQSE